MKKCGELWNALSENEKDGYKQQANEDKARFDREIAEECSNNGGKRLLTSFEKKTQLAKLLTQPASP